MLQEYKLSLKMPEAEEFIDLIFYRPVAFILVKTIYKLPVTPNQVSLLSMLIGLFAAWQFSVGTSDALILGGLLFLLSNILDCADGQLARLQKSGTLLGRVIDGVADYIVGVAIFVGIGFGITSSGNSLWLMVIFAGISSALHAMFFDYYQSEFISTVRGEKNFLDREKEQFSYEIKQMKEQRRDGLKIFLLSLYLRYLDFQRKSGTKSDGSRYNSEIYRKENSVMIRLWSFLGPTTNRTLLIGCAFIGRIDFYLWIILLAGNIWLIFSYLFQYRIHKKLEAA